MKRTIIVIIAVAIAAAGWFFVSPLFIDKTVDAFDAAMDSADLWQRFRHVAHLG